MSSPTTRIITIALAILALAAPVAAAAPMRDGSPPLVQDHSRPDIGHVYVPPSVAQHWATPTPAPAPAKAEPPATTSDNDPSALVYILASLALVGMAAATVAYVRGSRRPAQV
jgi:hypothetical protein